MPLRSAVAGGRTEGILRTALVVGLPVFVTIASLALSLLARMPPIPSDQLNYFEFARDLPDVPDSRGVFHQFQRIGLVLPLALAIKALGYTPLAYYAVPILASVALALSVYCLGTLFFNRVAGAAAGLLVVGNSAIFVDLATPLPDVLSTALFCWAMVLTIALRQGRPLLTATRGRRNAALVGIGLLLGWSYLTREFIVLLWPLVPILLFRPVGFRGLLWVALPLAIIGIGELALNAALYQDPLARVRSVVGHGQGPMSSELLSGYRDRERLWYANVLPEALRAFPEGGWLIASLVMTLAGAIAWPSHRVLLGWFACLALPLSLLGGVLDPAEPMLRLTNFRYWFPIVPAIVLGGVGGVWLATRSLAGLLPITAARRDAAAGILAFAVAIPPLAVAADAREQDPRYIAGGAVQLESLQSWLLNDGEAVDRLWTDSRTSRIIPLFATGSPGQPGWDGDVLALRAEGDAPQPGDHVLLYSEGRGVCTRCRDALARVLGSPVAVPPSWSPVFATEDGIVRVYEVR
jgi:hypothetical protein